MDSTILDDAVARQDTVKQLVAQIRRVGREVPGADALVAGLPGHDYQKPGNPDIAWDDKADRDDLVSRLGTVGPDARHAHKSREKKQDGFKAHVAIEPDTGLVTAAVLTKASGAENSDAARGAELITADTSIGSDTVEVLADSAYGSGDLLAEVTAAGHIPIIKPMPLSRAVPGGFTIDDYTVDEAAGTMTCPAGLTRPISPKRRVTFGAACTGCALRAQCTTAVGGWKLELHPQQQVQREHRARAQDPHFQAVYRQHRPMVERSIAWMTRGARRVPYRGVVKNHAWWTLRAAGVNLKRLLSLGLTTDNGNWALA